MGTQQTYTIDLTVDQRPTKREIVSEAAYLKMARLGWFNDGRAKVIGSNGEPDLMANLEASLHARIRLD